jgi:hypothetical protein
MKTRILAAFWAVLGFPLAAASYPGGTPTYQTDVAPFCAGCHASRDAAALAGAEDLAQQEVAERKHIALILSGQQGYASLSETDRQALAEQVRALDEASTVTLAAPAAVITGQSFQVAVNVTGGAGPALGVALVDRAHRWYAAPAPSAGWSVAEPPRVTGPDGQLQSQWISKRPESAGRNLAFVNITEVSSDSTLQQWGSASVVFTLRAPDRPGSYPLAAAYFYGTETSTVLGYTTDPSGVKQPRGGFEGGSGRVLFSKLVQIQVQPAQAATPPPAGPPSPPQDVEIAPQHESAPSP